MCCLICEEVPQPAHERQRLIRAPGSAAPLPSTPPRSPPSHSRDEAALCVPVGAGPGRDRVPGGVPGHEVPVPRGRARGRLAVVVQAGVGEQRPRLPPHDQHIPEQIQVQKQIRFRQKLIVREIAGKQTHKDKGKNVARESSKRNSRGPGKGIYKLYIAPCIHPNILMRGACYSCIYSCISSLVNFICACVIDGLILIHMKPR